MPSKHQKKKNKRPTAGAAAPVREEKTRYFVHNSIVSYYLFLMFGIFTLFLSRGNYSTARHDKFYFYLALSGVFIFGAGAAYLIARSEQNRVSSSLNSFFKPLSVTDGAMLCFTFFALISTFGSKYASGAWIAEYGRNNGMLLLLFYLAVYFLVSRLYVYKDYVIAIFLISSCVVALLTVLNFFYIDPVGLLEGYKGTKYEADFGSTIGNKNTIASYMSLFLPIAMMTLVLNKERYMRIIAGVSIVFAYTGALSANSGSVFLGLFVALPAMAVFCAQRYDRLMRYMLALTILFASGKLLNLFSYLQNDSSKGFESIQHYLIYEKTMYIPIVVCGAITLTMYLLRDRLQPHYPAKAVTITLISLMALAVTGLLGVFLYYSVIDTTTPLGSNAKLLRFNDAWGTHRGVMWNHAMDEYRAFGFFNKIFGAGPDTAFYVLGHPDALGQVNFDWLKVYGNDSTNCVHNEYINYLITQGALGLLSYLAILGGVCVRAFRRAKNNPTVLIFISAIVCYAAQSIVNLYQPITTPLLFLFISMAEALNRQTNPSTSY